LAKVSETIPIYPTSTSPNASGSPEEPNSLETSQLSATEDLSLAPNGIALNDSHIGNGLLLNGQSGVPKPHPNALTIDMHDGKVNGTAQSEDIAPASFSTTPNGSALANEHSRSLARSGSKSQKSVRFSPTVEKNTFIQTEPPSPDPSVDPATSTSTNIEIKEELTIQEQEHFQLMMEEAFFLSYSLGALSIFDSTNNSPISNQDLFSLFRKSSHFPPLSNPVLAPDDSFLLNYVVYHHYRSLGWCVRGGAKFSCDFMLYNRGPVFSHAEFAILIIPSYTDPYWSSGPFVQNYVKGREKRNWSWMHCMNRVISQVKKKLILVYVDVPSPMGAEAEKGLRIDEILGRYTVREFVMRRWLSNRERK
jgi:tRNA-splicing endonuclease subunit Sen2